MGFAKGELSFSRYTGGEAERPVDGPTMCEPNQTESRTGEAGVSLLGGDGIAVVKLQPAMMTITF